MSVRVFELNRDGLQAITVAQSGARAAVTVSLNDRILGTLSAPEEKSAGRDFTLDDGSILTVRVVKKQAQVRHNGLPLFAARPRKEAARVLWTKRVMLICAVLAPILGIISLFISLSTIAFCFQRNSSCSTNQTLVSLPPALLGAGYALLPLIACLVGILSASVTHRWKWLVFGLGPLLLLQIGYLTWLLLLAQHVGFSHDLVSVLEDFFLATPLGVILGAQYLAAAYDPLFTAAFASPLLASVVCLIYAVRLE